MKILEIIIVYVCTHVNEQVFFKPNVNAYFLGKN